MHALKSAVSRSVNVDTDKVAARERHAVRVAEVVARLRSGAGR